MFRYAVWFSLFVLIPGHLWGTESYHWPMAEAAPALTSSFAEYRGGRLHAAIDLKTWGKEGFPAVAVADGYVWRVRTSPWGYGRVVYVKMHDGRFALWAHLSGFSERIEKYVQAEQDRRGTYSVNLFFREDQLPVKRGEVLGFSGSTGIGYPHLHFELRNAQNQPINPLTHGFSIKDTLPPTLYAVGLVPQDGGAQIDGAAASQVVSLKWLLKQKRYVYPDTLTLWGRVGVALDVYDRSDASALANKQSPYRLRLLADDKEAFAVTYTHFGYDVTNDGELDRNFLLSQHGFGHFHNLYREAGNLLPFYGPYREGDGVLYAGIAPTRAGFALAPGVHTLHLVAEDVRGNRSEALLTVRVAQMPEIAGLQTTWADTAVAVALRLSGGDRALFERSTDGGNTWHAASPWLPAGDRLQRKLSRLDGALYRVRVENATGQSAFQTFAAPQSEPVALSCRVDYFPLYAVVRAHVDRVPPEEVQAVVRFPDEQAQVCAVCQKGLLDYDVVVPFDAHTDGDAVVEIRAGGAERSVTVIQQKVTKTQGGDIASADGRVRVHFDPDGVYDTLFGRVRIDSAVTDSRLVGPAFHLMPEDVAFADARVTLAWPAHYDRPEKLGLYEWGGDKGWMFVDNGRDSTQNAVTGAVKHLGVFALLVDDAPPEITGVFPKNGEELTDRQPQVRATVRDTTSGIWREEDIDFTLDRERLIVEFDPEAHTMVARPRRALAPGPHRLYIRVRDICGNEAQHTSTFAIK